MEQRFEDYKNDDHGIWAILYNRQLNNLKERVCSRYIECLDLLGPYLNGEKIPRFSDLDHALLSNTGWSIQIVPGLIPVEQFFTYLAEKRFCSSRWLRARHQLDYIEEPDMFHDIFGHIPLLMDSHYASFTQKIGALGLKYINNPIMVKQLQRIYWYTIEFGILKEDQNIRIYGAGIISSPKESDYVYDDRVNRIPFDLEKIVNTEFRTDVLQDSYYFIESFKQLYDSLYDFEEMANGLALKRRSSSR